MRPAARESRELVPMSRLTPSHSVYERRTGHNTAAALCQRISSTAAANLAIRYWDCCQRCQSRPLSRVQRLRPHVQMPQEVALAEKRRPDQVATQLLSSINNSLDGTHRHKVHHLSPHPGKVQVAFCLIRCRMLQKKQIKKTKNKCSPYICAS